MEAVVNGDGYTRVSIHKCDMYKICAIFLIIISGMNGSYARYVINTPLYKKFKQNSNKSPWTDF